MRMRNAVVLAVGLLTVAFVTREAVSQNAKDAPKDKPAAGSPAKNEQEAAMMQG